MTETSTPTVQSVPSARIDYLDTLRTLACFMVVFVHAGDPYVFLSGDQVPFLSSVYVSIMRPCVPLFIMISGVLLLPLKMAPGPFFKRRFSRVLIPFLLWSLIYVFLPIPGEVAVGGPANALANQGLAPWIYNMLMIPINFTASNVHFWFIYTILGLYLFMPIISPWLAQARKKDVQWFLSIWSVTLFFPYVRIWFPEILGQCDWNDFDMLHYFSGGLGYVILGWFLHRYNTLSPRKSILIGLALMTVGFLVTWFGFQADVKTWLSHDKAIGRELERSVGFLTINVVMLTAGLYMIVQKLRLPQLVRPLISELSRMSYGIFLVHYIFILWITAALAMKTGLPAGVEQIVLAVIVFSVSYATAKVISFLPRSRYLLG